jgi:hypothetical protein
MPYVIVRVSSFLINFDRFRIIFNDIENCLLRYFINARERLMSRLEKLDCQ